MHTSGSTATSEDAQKFALLGNLTQHGNTTPVLELVSVWLQISIGFPDEKQWAKDPLTAYKEDIEMLTLELGKSPGEWQSLLMFLH